MEKLVFLLDDFGTLDIIKEKVIWNVCNLTRGKYWEIMASNFLDIVAPLSKYLNCSTDDKEIRSCLYAIFKLTSSSTLITEKFISQGVYSKLSEIVFETPDETIKIYCIKVIANLLGADDVQTQRLINQGILYIFKNLLEEVDLKVLKEALWGISNIAAGTWSQIDKLIEEGILIKIMDIADQLIPMADTDKAYRDTLREALFCITNSISGGLNIARVNILQNGKYDLFKILFSGFEFLKGESKLISMILLSLKHYLELEEEEGMLDVNFSIRDNMLNMGLENVLESFLNYPNENVKNIVESMLDKYS
jgi:hypothetical protein